MKGKKSVIVILILTSLILPISNSALSNAIPQPANGDIGWGVNEGKTIT